MKEGNGLDLLLRRFDRVFDLLLAADLFESRFAQTIGGDLF